MSETSEKLKKANDDLVKEINCRIESLGKATSGLFEALIMIQQKFDAIRNVPDDKIIQYKEIKKICLNWKSQVDKIDADYNSVLKASVGKGVVGAGLAGAGLGVGVATFGPTAAMGIATTFGVASTGTAISALSGAAATNAALAWLGGGALAAGGGGMAAGGALLAMSGPIGWGIVAASIVIGSASLFWWSRSRKERLEKIFIRITKRDQESYKTAIDELNEREKRVTKETDCLYDAIEKIETFGTDYTSMSEAQQYELGSYVNLMNSSSQLLVNPIQGLQPKYTDEDLSLFCHAHTDSNSYINCEKNFFVSMCNFLYKIKTDDEDRSLLYKTFRKNKKFLEQVRLNKSSSLEKWHFDMVDKMLSYKYEKDKR